MSTTIPQRDLRNHNAQIMDRVAAGESFVVTRDGVPIADITPHVPKPGPRRWVPAAELDRRPRLTKEEAADWMADIRSLDEFIDPTPIDPWERAEQRTAREQND